MRIWIVNHYALPASESGGTRHYSLAKELVRRDHDVTILASRFHHRTRSEARSTPAESSKRDEIDGVRFHWVDTPRYAGNGVRRMRNMLSFAGSIRRRSAVKQLGIPDLVLGSSPHPFAAYAALQVARRHGVPFVLEIRDLWPDSLVKVAGVSPRHPLVLFLRRLERHLYRSADAVITLLPAAAEHIVARGGDRRRIFWVPNGVDFHLAPPVRPRDAQAPFTVTYAGSHGIANAIDSMVEAARLLRDHAEPRIQFRFIGEGPERARLRRMAEEQGLRNVRFDDPVPKQQVYAALQDADVLLATTRNIDLYAHGLSFNKLFDYLAAGRPIVFGAACPGNPVEEADAGLIVAPEDSTAMANAILSLATMRPEERLEVGMRGRRFAEHQYDIRNLAERLESALQFAIRSHDRR